MTKSFQAHSVNAAHNGVICQIVIYDHNATLYSKNDWISNLWQEFEFASELVSDLRDTVNLQ